MPHKWCYTWKAVCLYIYLCIYSDSAQAKNKNSGLPEKLYYHLVSADSVYINLNTYRIIELIKY